MRTTTTRTILRILDKAEYLGKSIRTHMAAVSLKLTMAFGALPPRGEEDPPWPDWEQVQAANLELLEHHAGETHGADQAYRSAKVAVAQAMAHRDGVRDSLIGRHRSLRTSFRGAYSEVSLALVGLEEAATERYLPLREQCRDFVVRVRRPGLAEVLGAPDADHAPLDFDRLATGMETELGVYEAALDAVTEARKRRDAAFAARSEAEDRLNSVYANVARVQEGYYRLAELEELADRIRLTIPRSSPRPQDEPAPDTGEPGGEPEPPPPPPDGTPTA